MKIIDQVPTVFTIHDAQTKVDILHACEIDGWTYTVKPDPNGSDAAFIEVYDECGEFVGRL